MSETSSPSRRRRRAPRRAHDPAEAEEIVRTLAAIDRPSASPGEREAGEWIAARLRELGYEPRVEEEQVVGGYWLGNGVLNVLGVLAARASLRGRRLRALLLGGFAAAALWDDIDHRSRWFRRGFLPKRTTANVWAEAGDPRATRTIVVVAHHDAAHSGLVFHPGAPEFVNRHFPAVIERGRKSAQLMWLVFLGPALAALAGLTGRRLLARVGSVLSAGSAAAMADIASRPAVPGANDNLSGVAVVLQLARALRDEPVSDVRVILMSSGSEESNSEGFQQWGRRWFDTLPREATVVVAVDTVGSPTLCVVEGEGMLRTYDYDEHLKDLAADVAEQAGVTWRRGLWTGFATDGQIARHNGFRTCMLGSVNHLKLPDNYHWPTDDADHCDYSTVVAASTVVEGMVRRLAAGEASF